MFFLSFLLVHLPILSPFDLLVLVPFCSQLNDEIERQTNANSGIVLRVPVRLFFFAYIISFELKDLFDLFIRPSIIVMF